MSLSEGGKVTVNACKGVRGGEGVERIARLDNAAKVEDVDIVR